MTRWQSLEVLASLFQPSGTAQAVGGRGLQVFAVGHERAATAPMQEAFQPMDPLGVVGTVTLELGTSSTDELRARVTS